LTEYALILVLIAILAIAAVTGLGTKVKEIFESITGSLATSE
jgi:Flp pilus assembly pilin Flp